MKIVTRLNEALIIGILLLLVTVPIALAEYAVTRVYFNVPSDTSFSISMPSDYAANKWNITATEEATANETDWISFNFTTAPQATLQQPWRVGLESEEQDGSSKPIMMLQPRGNTNLTFTMYRNVSLPDNVFLYVNATCFAAGYCQDELTTLTAVDTSPLILATQVAWDNTNGRLNVTLWANTSSGVIGGQTSIWLFTNTSAS